MCSSSAVVNDWRMFPPGFHELDQTLLALLRRRRTGGTPAHPWPPFPPRPRLAPVSHPPPPALHARRQTMDCGRKRLLLPCSTYLQEKTWEEQPRKSKGLSEHGIPTSNSHTTPHCLHFCRTIISWFWGRVYDSILVRLILHRPLPRSYFPSEKPFHTAAVSHRSPEAYCTVLADRFRQNAQENCQNARKNAPA